MPQSTILAAGTSGATSTDVVVASGSTANVGIFTAANVLMPLALDLEVRMATPGGDALVTFLTSDQRVVSLRGPGTYRVFRPANSEASVGVFLET